MQTAGCGEANPYSHLLNTTESKGWRATEYIVTGRWRSTRCRLMSDARETRTAGHLRTLAAHEYCK